MKKFLLTICALLAVTLAMADEYKLTKCGGTVDVRPFGSREAGKLSTASQFYPDDITLLAGGRITAIRYFLAWTPNVTSFKVWVKKNYDDTETLTEKEVKNYVWGWNDITLDTPVEITPDTPIAIGCSFEYKGECYPMAFRSLKIPGGIYLNTDDEGWVDWTETYGCLCIEGVVDCPKITQSKASVSDLKIPSHYYALGQKDKATISFHNQGCDITSVTLRLAYGETVTEKTVKEKVPFGSYYTTTMPFNVPDEVNAHCDLNVSISAINGEPYEGQPSTITYGAYESKEERKVVIEEATATWCGWCVRGFVAMEQMKRAYPDSFIGIAVHSSDEMSIPDYSTSSLGIGSLPGCAVDRLPAYNGTDVNPDGFKNYYAAERERTTYAALTLKASIIDGNIEGEAVATFDHDDDNADLRMVYVLIENGITGYTQYNYYSGGAYGEMDGFENMPDAITFQVYNDVARAIYPNMRGEKLSMPTSFAKGEECTNMFAYPLPGNIKNADKLELAALLLDGASGEIVQACKVKPDQPDFIEGVSATTADSRWYSIDGAVLLRQPSRPGLYIKDGKKSVVQ